jgi:putative transposase
MEEYHKHKHAVYRMSYHMVFVTKYRRKCISDEIGDFMKKRAGELLPLLDGELISAETDQDHIHLLVDLPPTQRPADVVRILKTQLSKDVHKNQEYAAYLKQYLYDGKTLWSPSYFICTTGSLVLEKVKEYINSQRTDDHKRKYVKSGNYQKNKGRQ